MSVASRATWKSLSETGFKNPTDCPSLASSFTWISICRWTVASAFDRENSARSALSSCSSLAFCARTSGCCSSAAQSAPCKLAAAFETSAPFFGEDASLPEAPDPDPDPDTFRLALIARRAFNPTVPSSSPCELLLTVSSSLSRASASSICATLMSERDMREISVPRGSGVELAPSSSRLNLSTISESWSASGGIASLMYSCVGGMPGGTTVPNSAPKVQSRCAATALLTRSASFNAVPPHRSCRLVWAPSNSR
mmetsp:Transcript_12534/g.26412  ORF Transcript_12534/g.26412 Transcript_12534/m.26412 type:complete len:254 (+) Transcript_12534:6061-6822(+)